MQSVIPGGGASQRCTNASDPFAAFSKFFRSKLEQIVLDPPPNEFRSDPILAQPLKSNIAVECWLNERLGRDPLIHVCDEIDALLPDSGTQPTPYVLQRRVLYNLGIARNQLSELGLESIQIDRLYRGLFVYSNGILEMFSALNPEVLKRIWKVYWTIIDSVNDHKSKTAISEVKNDFMRRLLEFRDRQLRMTTDTAQQKQKWQKEMKALTDLIENRDRTVSQLETAIGHLQQHSDSLNETITTERLHNVELTQQGEIWRSWLSQSIVDLDRLRRDKAETDAMIGIVTLKRKKLEDQLADKEKRFVEMEFTERTLSQEKARYERRAVELLSALQSAQAAHRVDLSRINDMTHQRQLQDRIVAQLQADLAVSTRKLTLETTFREALDQKYAAAVTTIDDLTAENADLQAKLMTATEQLRTRSTELDHVRLELLALREQFEAQTTELTGVTQIRDELRVELDRTIAESRTASTQLCCMREQLANMRRAWDDNRRRVVAEQRELMDAKATIVQLKQDSAQQRQRIESLMMSVNDGKEQLKAIVAQHQRDVAQLRFEHRNVCVQRDEYIEMTVALKAAHERLQQDVSKLEAVITSKNSHIAEYRQRTEENVAEIQGLKIDLDVQLAKAAAAETRLNGVKAELVEVIEANVRLMKLQEDGKQTLIQSRNQCDQLRLANDTLRRDMEYRIQQVVNNAEGDRQRSEKRLAQQCESQEKVAAEYEERLAKASDVEQELEKLLLARVEQCKSLSHDLSEQFRSNRETIRQYNEQILTLQQEKTQIESELQTLQATLPEAQDNSSLSAERRRQDRDALLAFLERERTPVETISIAIQTVTIFDIETLPVPVPIIPEQQSVEVQTDPVGLAFNDSFGTRQQSRRNSQSLASVHVRSPSISTATDNTDTFAAAIAPFSLANLKMKAARLARKHHGSGGVRLPPVIAGRAGPSPAVAEAMAANNVWMAHDDDLSMTGLAFASVRHP